MTTRATIEKLVVKRCGALMAAAGLVITYAGSNDDLNDPIGWAVRKAGGSVSDAGSVADADVQTVADADFDALVDLAEYRALVNVKGNYALVDTKSGQYSESLSQMVNNLQQLIEQKWLYIKNTYGIGSAVMEVGVITSDFATHGDDPVEDYA